MVAAVVIKKRFSKLLTNTSDLQTVLQALQHKAAGCGSGENAVEYCAVTIINNTDYYVYCIVPSTDEIFYAEANKSSASMYKKYNCVVITMSECVSVNVEPSNLYVFESMYSDYVIVLSTDQCTVTVN